MRIVNSALLPTVLFHCFRPPVDAGAPETASLSVRTPAGSDGDAWELPGCAARLLHKAPDDESSCPQIRSRKHRQKFSSQFPLGLMADGASFHATIRLRRQSC